MPIINVAEVKKKLNIPDADHDVIAQLIKEIQDHIVNKTHNKFLANNNTVLVSTLVFDNGDNTIVDSAEGFVTAGFIAGMDISIMGSLYNDNIVTLETVTAGILTLSSSDTLTDENSALAITFEWVKFPQGIKPVVAKMIAVELSLDTEDRVQSEHVGNTTFNYGGLYKGEYSDGIYKQLKPWTLPVFV